ncbi:hypothetical protein Tco_0079703 [Tanacetum coccineum]
MGNEQSNQESKIYRGSAHEAPLRPTPPPSIPIEIHYSNKLPLGGENRLHFAYVEKGEVGFLEKFGGEFEQDIDDEGEEDKEDEEGDDEV